ncbi:MAG: hypothetical protein J1E32_07665 [Treponema sp.]|nr:hypothetical protein [Treponema sp.]
MQATALKDETINLLDSLSDEQMRYALGVTRSLPREKVAMKKTYTAEDAQDAFGLWKDREDYEDVAEYARRVRKGRTR